MKGKNDNALLWIALGVIGLAGFGIIQIPGFFSSIGDGTTSTTLAQTCGEMGTTQSYDPNAKDSLAGSAVAEANLVYRNVNGGVWTAGTEGTAITGLMVGGDYEIVYGITLTDFLDNAYGPHVVVNDLPCVVDATTEVYADSTTTVETFYNSDDTASTYEAVTVGETPTVYFKYVAGHNTVYGNPYLGDFPNAFCLSQNLTAWDTPLDLYIVSGKTVDGRDLSNTRLNTVAKPTALAAVSGDNQYCWEAPVITDLGIKFGLMLDADDTAASLDDSTGTMFAGHWFLDQDSNLKSGYETDQGAVVGATTVQTVGIDFSA